MPILVFTTALTLPAYGAFLGNVGTAYRQRTQMFRRQAATWMMFYFLFIADGLHRKRRTTGSEEPSTAHLPRLHTAHDQTLKPFPDLERTAKLA